MYLKHRTLLAAIFFMALLNRTPLHGQEVGSWSVAAAGAYSHPVGGLSGWFKGAPGFEIAAGRRHNDSWSVDGIIELARCQRENLSGYAQGKLNLELEHLALLVGGRYEISEWHGISPYFAIAGGLYFWKGVRGSVSADSTVTPSVPYIAERVLREANWGFRSGLGVSLRAQNLLAVECQLYYRFVIGDLWPTMQPNIELEGVSGFQSLNISLAIRYWL